MGFGGFPRWGWWWRWQKREECKQGGTPYSSGTFHQRQTNGQPPPPLPPLSSSVALVDQTGPRISNLTYKRGEPAGILKRQMWAVLVPISGRWVGGGSDYCCNPISPQGQLVTKQGSSLQNQGCSSTNYSNTDMPPTCRPMQMMCWMPSQTPVHRPTEKSDICFPTNHLVAQC